MKALARKMRAENKFIAAEINHPRSPMRFPTGLVGPNFPSQTPSPLVPLLESLLVWL